jgi:hypothetical protein
VEGRYPSLFDEKTSSYKHTKNVIDIHGLKKMNDPFFLLEFGVKFATQKRLGDKVCRPSANPTKLFSSYS